MKLPPGHIAVIGYAANDPDRRIRVLAAMPAARWQRTAAHEIEHQTTNGNHITANTRTDPPQPAPHTTPPPPNPPKHTAAPPEPPPSRHEHTQTRPRTRTSHHPHDTRHHQEATTQPHHHTTVPEPRPLAVPVASGPHSNPSEPLCASPFQQPGARTMPNNPVPAPIEPPDTNALHARPGDIVMIFRLGENSTASPLSAQDAILAALRQTGLLPADRTRDHTDAADIANFRRRGRLQTPIVRRLGRLGGWR